MSGCNSELHSDGVKMNTDKKNISVGIVSNQKLIRNALYCLMLTFQLGSVSLVVDADTMADASARIAFNKPDILLWDCENSTFCFGGVRNVEVLSSSTKCLLLVDDVEEKFAAQAAHSGAWGIISKKANPEMMRKAIHTLMNDQLWFGRGVITAALRTMGKVEETEGSPLERLTQREAEILALLAKSYRNKEIAAQLFLSQNTVRRYLETIYEKLEVHSRVEAVTLYLDTSN